MSFYILTFTIISTILSTTYTVPQNVNNAVCVLMYFNEEDILFAQKNCTTIILSGLTIPPGKTLDLTHLNQGSKVTFEGTITWEYEEWSGPLLKVSGIDIEITGSFDHMLDGRGNLWWDGLGTDGGKKKPKFFTVHEMYNSRIKNIHIKNSPAHVFTIKESDGLTLENITIDDRDGDSQGGANTDGFDIAHSNDVMIRNSVVYNQDDCLAVKSGSYYEFHDSFCSGGHGISIGSVANMDSVESIYFSNIQVENSTNGVRIKTVYGATGYVSNITYEDITLKDIIDYGVIIEGDYINSEPTGTPSDTMPITHLILRNITGTVKESGTNVYILVDRAVDWHCSGINVTGGQQTKECQGIPSDSGMSC